MGKLINKINKKTKIQYFLFSVFIFLLLIPRFIVFSTKLDYFGGDFAFYYFLTRDIVVNLNFPLIGHVVGEIGGFTQGPLWSYLLVPFFIFFDGNPIGGKMFMLLISLFILIFGSFFAWKYLGKIEGILIAFFLGSSPYLIKWTNLAWPPYVIPLITIFHLYFLFIFLSKKQNKYFYLSVSSLGLMAHFEVASLALLLPSFMLLTIYLLYRKALFKLDILKSLFIFSLFFVPHLIYDLNNKFYNLKGILSILTPDSKTNNIMWQIIIANRLHLFKTDLIAVFPIFDYKVLLIVFVFILLGFILFLKDRKIKKVNKLFIWYLLMIIPLTFFGVCLIPVKSASFWWFSYLTIVYIFLSGIILTYLLKKKIIYALIVITIIIINLKEFSGNLNSIFSKERELRNIKYEISIQAPIEDIYQDAINQSFKVLYVTGNHKVIDYKYMFLFIGKSKFNDSPYLENIDLNYTAGGGIPLPINESEQFKKLTSGIYYIIITNEASKSEYSNKLLNNKNIGVLLNEKKIQNGSKSFIVQKRVIK